MAIYLGLGANLGDRRVGLAGAIAALTQGGVNVKRVSPVYETPALLPRGAPGEWNIPYLNCVVEVETSLSPSGVLAVGQHIEGEMGRSRNKERWAPRPIDIDILVWGDEIIDTPYLTLPHPEICNRAFVLDPLSHMDPHLKLPGADRNILQLARAHVQHQPLIMGILNITADSFSDGGVHDDPDQLARTVKSWTGAGIHILDIGVESTRPEATPLSPAEEWEKLTPFLDILKTAKDTPLAPLLSIDTYHPETAEKAIEWGFDIINDVSGLKEQAMRDIVRQSNVTCVAMHSLSVPADKNVTLPPDCDPVAELRSWLDTQIDVWGKEGLDIKNIIFDPGIGFGKTAHQSLQILRNIEDFMEAPLRILAGHSRKSLMNIFSEEPYAARDWETVGLSLTLAAKGIDILRVHDPLAHRRALQAALHIL